MNNTLKRVIIGVVTAALSCGAVYGGLISYRNVNASTVKVYNAGTIASQSYFYDDSSNTSYGTVSSDRMQSVFLTATMTVTEMLVETGDPVSKGDVLFTYDTTLSEIQVERAETELAEQQLSLERMTEDLEKLRKLSPSSGGSDYAGGDDADYDDGTESGEEDPDEDEITYSSESTPQLISEGADGTIDNPYVYLWGNGDPLTPRVLLQMFAPGQTISYSDTESNTDSSDTTQDTDQQDAAGEDTSADSTSSGSAGQEDAQDTETDPVDYDDSEYADDDAAEEEDDTIDEYYESPQDDGGQEYEDYGDDDYVSDDDESPDSIAYIIRAVTPRFAENEEETGSGVVGEEDTSSTQGIPVENLPSEVYVILQVHAYNNRDAEMTQQYGLHLYRVGEQVSVTLYNPDSAITTDPEEAEPTESEAEEVSGDDFGYDGDGYYDSGSDSSDAGSENDTLSTIGIYRSDIDWTASYTAKEIAEMIEQKETDVRDLTLTVKKAEISLREMKAELSDGSVKAKFDGEIQLVRDPEDAKNSGSAVVVVSGGGGYFVTFSLGELDLETVTVGSQVEISSYETGMIYAGTIRSVSDYPSTGNDFFYSAGNPLVSYYPARVQVEEFAEMKDGDYVSVEYNTGEEAVTGLYLDKMFVRSEDGQRYVYVRNSEGRLEKRIVATGKVLMDSYIQIRSGITSDDWIAFPYGSAVKEGVKAVEAEYSELYE